MLERPDWTVLAPTVRSLQRILESALEASTEGNEHAADFVQNAYGLTEHRVSYISETFGLDMHNEWQLFSFATGYAASIMVAHEVLHLEGWYHPDEDACGDFYQGTIVNLMPLLPLMPLEIILGDEGPLDWTEVDRPC